MVKPVARRLITGLCAFFLLALCFTLPASAAAGSAQNTASVPAAVGGAAADPVATTHPGAERFGSCLTAARKGDILLLIDESPSIGATDRENARVTAAIFLLRQFLDSTQTSKVQLSVAIAGFGHDFDLVTPWTQLTEQALPGFDGSLNSFKGRIHGFETDYWTALEGARALLADKTNADGVPVGACQAIIWFTDGQLSLAPRLSDADQASGNGVTKPYAPGIDLTSADAVAQARKAAKASLCNPGGLMDQLRSSGVVTLAVGLQSPVSGRQDFDLLQAAAEGTGGPVSCGAIKSPSPGDFQTVTDLDGLLSAFDTDVSPAVESDQPICQRTMCAEGEHTFVLDNSISSVRVLGSSDYDGLTVRLTAPDGQFLTIAAGSSSTAAVGGVTAKYGWESGKTVQIQIAQPADQSNWAGQWSATFIDPKGASASGKSHTNVHIAADLSPTVVNAASLELRAGDKNDRITFGLVDPAGKVVPAPSLLGILSVDVTLTPTGGQTIPVASDLNKATLETPVTVDLSKVNPGDAILRLTLNLTTAETKDRDGTPVHGTALSPATQEFKVKIAPPPNFPVVAGTVDFGSIEGAGAHAAGIDVTGPGCLWLPAANVTLTGKPESVGSIAVGAGSNTAPSGCLTLQKGERSRLPITLTTGENGKGSIIGQLTVMSAPAGQPDRAVPVTVVLSADVVKSLDVTTAWLAFTVALLIALLIPVLLLYGAKWWAAVIPAGTMRTLRIPVSIRDGRVLRGDMPFALHESDDLRAESVLGRRGSRKATLAGSALAAKVGLAPTSAPYVRVESAGLIGGSGDHPASVGSTPAPRLPLGVRNSWFFLRGPNERPDQGTVTFLFSANAHTRSREELARQMVERLPAVAASLDASASPTAAPPGPRVPGGPPMGQPPGRNEPPQYGNDPSYQGPPPPAYGAPPPYSSPPQWQGAQPPPPPPPWQSGPAMRPDEGAPPPPPNRRW